MIFRRISGVISEGPVPPISCAASGYICRTSTNASLSIKICCASLEFVCRYASSLSTSQRSASPFFSSAFSGSSAFPIGTHRDDCLARAHTCLRCVGVSSSFTSGYALSSTSEITQIFWKSDDCPHFIIRPHPGCAGRFGHQVQASVRPGSERLISSAVLPRSVRSPTKWLSFSALTMHTLSRYRNLYHPIVAHRDPVTVRLH
jgi:hypothetical protein